MLLEDNVSDFIKVGGVQKLQEGEFIVQATKDCVAKTLKRLGEKIHGRVLNHLLYLMRVAEKVVQRRIALALAHLCVLDTIQDVYDTAYETCGQYWPYIHHYVIVAIALMQITMIGLFGLKSKPAASISTVPLFLLTLLFNEYCKIRFLPTFFNYSIQIQNAVKNDELDQMEGPAEANRENAIVAYVQPFVRPMSFLGQESSSTQPLVSSA